MIEFGSWTYAKAGGHLPRKRTEKRHKVLIKVRITSNILRYKFYELDIKGVRLSVAICVPQIPWATKSLFCEHPELNYTHLICRTQKPLPKKLLRMGLGGVWSSGKWKTRNETTRQHMTYSRNRSRRIL